MTAKARSRPSGIAVLVAEQHAGDDHVDGRSIAGQRHVHAFDGREAFLVGQRRPAAPPMRLPGLDGFAKVRIGLRLEKVRIQLVEPSAGMFLTEEFEQHGSHQPRLEPWRPALDVQKTDVGQEIRNIDGVEMLASRQPVLRMDRLPVCHGLADARMTIIRHISRQRHIFGALRWHDSRTQPRFLSYQTTNEANPINDKFKFLILIASIRAQCAASHGIACRRFSSPAGGRRIWQDTRGPSSRRRELHARRCRNGGPRNR